MESVQPLSAALQQSILATGLALSILALAWLVRRAFTREAEFGAQKDALQKEMRDQLQAANAAHLQTALQIAPLALKLTECVGLLERMMSLQQRGTP